MEGEEEAFRWGVQGSIESEGRIDPRVKWNLKAGVVLYDAYMLMIKHLALYDALSNPDLTYV